jgi:hypothetical protein
MAATWIHDLHDEWPRMAVRGLIMAIGGMLAGTVAVLSNGNLVLPIALPIGLGVMLAIITHPSATFSMLLFCTLLFEQYQIFGVSAPLTLQIPFFENFNNSIGIPLPINPVEVLLGVIAGSWFMTGLVTRKIRFQASPLQAPMAALLMMFAFFMAFGIGRGGVINIALWELRALFYMGIAFFVGSQVIRTHKQVLVNTWCILIPISIKGFQGVWRWGVDLGFEIGNVQAITSHEGAVFIMTSFVFSLALVMFKGPKSMILYTALTGPTTFITFIYAQRRIAYGCLVFGIIMLFLYLPKRTKRLFINSVLAIIPIIALYFAVFWNSSSGIAMPVQQVRSVFGADASGEVDSSNTYRDVEKFNLIQTIRTYPAGVGFGNKYLIIMPLDEVDFPLWEYIPHNCILWIWVKTGFIGITLFFFCIGLMVMQLTIDFRTTTRPLYKCLIVVSVVFLICQVIVAYYDLQLTFYRNMIYLGSLLAMTLPIHAEAKRNKRLGLTCMDSHPVDDAAAAEGVACP